MLKKQFAYLATALTLSGLTTFVAFAPASMANPLTESTSARKQNSSTLRQGIPGRRLGGGTRQDIVFSNPADVLIALTASESLTITAEDSPQLLFYVPPMIDSNTVEFVVLNAQDELIYEKTFVVEPEAGVISVDVTDSSGASALSLNTDYQWYFSIIPDAKDRASDVVVHGGIRQVEQAAWLSQQATGLNLGRQLQSATPLKKARLLYQQANLWQDAAVLLNELRQAEPRNVAIANEWSQLLQSAGLSSNLQEPVSSTQIGLH